MFGTHIHFVQSPSRLTVIGPIDLWLLLGLSVFTLWPLLIFLFKRPLPKKKLAVAAVIAFVAFAFLPSGGRLTLNRTQGKATLSRFYFFHWHTITFPLSDLDNASVRTGSTTSQIQLQYTDGSVETLSELNQEGGKDEAVYAINKFLEQKRASEEKQP